MNRVQQGGDSRFGFRELISNQRDYSNLICVICGRFFLVYFVLGGVCVWVCVFTVCMLECPPLLHAALTQSAFCIHGSADDNSVSSPEGFNRAPNEFEGVCCRYANTWVLAPCSTARAHLGPVS